MEWSAVFPISLVLILQASEDASLRALESLMTEFFHNCTTNERKREIGKFCQLAAHYTSGTGFVTSSRWFNVGGQWTAYSFPTLHSKAVGNRIGFNTIIEKQDNLRRHEQTRIPYTVGQSVRQHVGLFICETCNFLKIIYTSNLSKFKQKNLSVLLWTWKYSKVGICFFLFFKIMLPPLPV